MVSSRTSPSLYHTCLLLTTLVFGYTTSFQTTTTTSTTIPFRILSSLHSTNPNHPHDNETDNTNTPYLPTVSSRRSLLSFLTTTAVITAASTSAFAEEEESFASLAARAAKLADQAKSIEDKTAEQEAAAAVTAATKATTTGIPTDERTVYDFTLPVKGEDVSFAELIGQEFEVGEDGVVGKKGVGVKAILVVNIKQDDPIARKNIPELLSLAARFGRNKEFAVISCPTDQGYFEPDTSELLRLKVTSEYGYGLNPAAILTDKVNLLGTGAHPFWRWIEGTCRTPSGLGRIQANYEKFLVDGRTGKPLRRYPRNYQPLDIADDIDAVMKGKTLPPAGANWREEWRQADKDAVSDQFRFQKGLNYFDQ